MSRAMTERHDMLLVPAGGGVYAAPNGRCSRCGRMQMVYAEGEEALEHVMRSAGSTSAELAGDAAIVCLACGWGDGIDASGLDIGVMEPDEYRDYVRSRAEEGLGA